MERDTLRICKTCGLEACNEKDLEEFVTDIGSKYGKKNLCKVCDSKRKKESYTYKRPIGDYLRKCLYCGVEAHTEEDLEEFVNHSEARHGKRNMCLACKKKLDASPDRIEAAKQKRYGISQEEYEEAMSTSHCCEICGSDKELCYDHDHSKTGMEAFRGVLCRACNGAIGILGDTLPAINRAAAYLKRYERKK